MVNEHLDEFLKEGVLRYADAYETIRLFREHMQARLEQILREKSDWCGFLPSGPPVSGTSRNGPAGFHIVWAYLPGMFLTEETSVTIGVFWGAPNQPPAVLYTCFPTRSTLLKKGVPYQGKDPRIMLAAFDGATRLCIEATPGLDLNGDFSLLLDALQDAATKLRAV